MSVEAILRAGARQARRSIFEAAGSDRYSRMSKHNIEEKLSRLSGGKPGTFIEAGANDGLNQSNTYWLERFRGWRGLLVEPVPEVAALCRRNRPRAKVVNAALVATPDVRTIRVAALGLYGYVTDSFEPDHEEKHRKSGVYHAGLPSTHVIQDIDVPARTLESVLDDTNLGPIDLFSLDVEGYELNVLRGMNMARYRPRYLMVEGGDTQVLAEFGDHYEFLEQITPHDVLLRAKR